MTSQIAPLDEAGLPSGTATTRSLRRVVIATGIVTPYTHRIYDGIATGHGIDLHVIACSPTEPNRQWQLPEANSYHRSVLRGLRWHRANERNVYFNPAVATEILRLRPDVLIVGDFSPTMLLAATTARLLGIPCAITSDTVPASDPGQHSLPHRIARRLMARLVETAIGGSTATLEVMARYGIGVGRSLVRPVVAGWDYDGNVPPRRDRPFDLMFCGTIEDRRKGALHFLDVVRRLVGLGRRPRIIVVGDGPLRGRLTSEFADLGLDAKFTGYLQQHELAGAYLSSKLLVFPSRNDPWGIVANEAAQCGTPIIISPHAQAAFDLVERHGAGTVVPLDVEAWAETIARYLDDAETWQRASEGGLAGRRELTLDAAVRGFVQGMQMARGS